MTTDVSPIQTIYFSYSNDIEQAITRLSTVIKTSPMLSASYNPRWLSIQLLEGDTTLLEKVEHAIGGKEVINTLNECIQQLETLYQEDIDIIITDQRYRFISSLVRRVVTRPADSTTTMSDKIDRFVTHRVFGIVMFLVLMWVVFKLTTDVAGPFIDWVDGVISGPVTNWVVALFGVIGLDGTWFESLIRDGVIAGVGGVLVFVPVLVSLYFAMAVLEDSGYMARAAFVMDRLMHTLGLHGKSFMPMVIGFGCTVPAIYATRTLENEKDRIITALLVPFMSCGARLPVYVMMTAIFFPEISGIIIWIIYLIGILMAVVLGIILKHTIFKDKEQAPFIMELPPYRKPTLKNIWFLMWERTSSFLHDASTVILITSIIVWFLIAIPIGGTGSFANTKLDESGLSALSRVIAPVFAPLGFGSWEASGSLVTGFVAKEVIISTMAQIYDVAETETEPAPTTFAEDVGGIVTSFEATVVDALKAVPSMVGITLSHDEEDVASSDLMVAVRNSFETHSHGHGALAAFAFMVFVLLYTPCMTTIAVERQELGMQWTWVSIIGQFVIAWMVAFLIFQGGKMLGWG